MIEKTIHYCWFGGNPLPELALKCISSWEKYCPDYNIVEWNEKNFDVNYSSYMKEAYDAEKWAFVSDFARLTIIYEHGGIYLDTDVEVLKNLDPLLANECFVGTEQTHEIATGLGFGAKKKHPMIKAMLDEYEDKPFFKKDGKIDYTPCPIRNTNAFLKFGYKISGDMQIINSAKVYPSEYFCPKSFETKKLILTDKTYTIHHYDSSWLTQKVRLKKALSRILGPQVTLIYKAIKLKIKSF